MSLKSVAFCSVEGWYGDGVSYIIHHCGEFWH